MFFTCQKKEPESSKKIGSNSNLKSAPAPAKKIGSNRLRLRNTAGYSTGTRASIKISLKIQYRAQSDHINKTLALTHLTINYWTIQLCVRRGHLVFRCGRTAGAEQAGADHLPAAQHHRDSRHTPPSGDPHQGERELRTQLLPKPALIYFILLYLYHEQTLKIVDWMKTESMFSIPADPVITLLFHTLSLPLNITIQYNTGTPKLGPWSFFPLIISVLFPTLPSPSTHKPVHLTAVLSTQA